MSCPGAEAPARCPICRAETIREADWRCEDGEDCPAEELWPDARCDECGEVICTCDCIHCGGDRYVEGDDPCWDEGEMVPCSGCRGTGLRRKQVIW